MIETERLVLSRPCLTDLEPVCAMWADPEVTRFITPQPMERRRSWMNLLFLVGHWELLGYGAWIAREKQTGAFVGQMGYQQFVRGIDPGREHLPEAGWVVTPAMWGKGYAAEAVNAFLAWGDRTLAAATTVAIVRDDNIPSLRLAEKVGYREITRAPYAGSQVVVFERVRRSEPA